MQIQHIGYQIRGFYRVAKIGHRWPMNPHAAGGVYVHYFAGSFSRLLLASQRAFVFSIHYCPFIRHSRRQAGIQSVVLAKGENPELKNDESN